MQQSPASPKAVRFGLFEADLAAAELRKRGRKIPLQDQPFRVLALLLRRAGELVTREEFQRALWPADTFVEFDEGLNKAIQKLRQALDDSSDNPRFIETLPRKGYRFIAPVERVAGEAVTPQPAPVHDSPVRTPGAAPFTRRKTGVLALVAFGIVSLVAASLYWFNWRGKATDSLAVLPFVNASGNPDEEYLSDGITENLINRLSQQPKLRVTARTLAFRYKGMDPQKAGRDLNVRAVLTGRVLERDGALNVQAELMNVDDGSQLWGRQYSRKLSDILTFQEEIAREISEKLRLKPTADQQKQLAKRSTENTEAYQLYLKGRYYWNRGSDQALKGALGYFQQAIDKDPAYALAYAGLADCYTAYSANEIDSPRESLPKTAAAARKALEIDDTLAGPHASLAITKMQYEWDWAGAEREFQRSIELDPNYARAHHWYGICLNASGRIDEALASMKRARQLDPLSPVISANVGYELYLARRYDEAIELIQKAIELDPGTIRGHWFLGMPYEQKAMYREAIAEFQKAFELIGGSPFALGDLGHAYALSGNRDKARQTLADLRELSKRRYVSPFDSALVYIGLGDRERAFEWLEKALEDRSWDVMMLKVDPRFDHLHADQRFGNLLRRMGLEP